MEITKRTAIGVTLIVLIGLTSWALAGTLTEQQYIDAGKAEFPKGNYETAISLFTAGLQLNPDNPGLYNDRGLCYLELGDTVKAISNFSKAIDLNPDFAKVYYNRGLAYFSTGSYYNKEPYHKAVADFTKAIELDPTYVDAYYHRGLTYEKIEGNKFYMSDGLYKALTDHEKALELDPMYVLAYAGRGNVFMRAGYNDVAVFEYNRALESENQIVQKAGVDGLAGLYASKARNYRYREEYAASISDYDRAIELDPTLTTALAHQIANYKNVGEWNKAIELCNMTIELKKDDPTYTYLYSKYLSKGLAYYNLGRYNESISNYNKAIELKPVDVASHRGLGIVYIEIGETEKAQEAFGKALEIDTSVIEKGTYKKMDRKYYSRGLTYYEMEEYDKAISDFKKAIELNSDPGYFGIGYYAKAYRDLGKAYLEIGEKAKAKEAFQTALRLFKEESRPYSAEQVKQLLELITVEASALPTLITEYSTVPEDVCPMLEQGLEETAKEI